ncbi:hypothetical protein ES703_46956 [subsurface metagenome]
MRARISGKADKEAVYHCYEAVFWLGLVVLKAFFWIHKEKGRFRGSQRPINRLYGPISPCPIVRY